MHEFSKQAGAVATNRSPLYREATETQKVTILNEFVAATGYARKYAIRWLNHPGVPHVETERLVLPAMGQKCERCCI